MIEFPLLTRICLSPGFDMEALLKAGYNSTNSYFSGKSRFNHSVIGWAGHKVDGGILSNAIQTYDYVKQNITLQNTLHSIHVKTLLGGRIFLNTEDVIQEETINYPDNCQTLDVTRHDVIKQEGVKDIQFRFQPFSENISVSVNLLGKSSACSRTLAELAFSQSGERIVFENYAEKRFEIKLHGNEVVEGIPGDDCRNYPNEHFDSYKECDDDYLRKELNRIAPEALPIWLTENLSLATPQKILTNSDGRFLIFLRVNF